MRLKGLEIRRSENVMLFGNVNLQISRLLNRGMCVVGFVRTLCIWIKRYNAWWGLHERNLKKNPAILCRLNCCLGNHSYLFFRFRRKQGGDSEQEIDVFYESFYESMQGYICFTNKKSVGLGRHKKAHIYGLDISRLVGFQEWSHKFTTPGVTICVLGNVFWKSEFPEGVVVTCKIISLSFSYFFLCPIGLRQLDEHDREHRDSADRHDLSQLLHLQGHEEIPEWGRFVQVRTRVNAGIIF